MEVHNTLTPLWTPAQEDTPSLLDGHRPTDGDAGGGQCRWAGASLLLLLPLLLLLLLLLLLSCRGWLCLVWWRATILLVMGFLSSQQPCKCQSMGVNYLPIGGNALQAVRESVTKRRSSRLPGKRGPMTLMQGDRWHTHRKTNFIFWPQKVVGGQDLCHSL